MLPYARLAIRQTKKEPAVIAVSSPPFSLLFPRPPPPAYQAPLLDLGFLLFLVSLLGGTLFNTGGLV